MTDQEIVARLSLAEGDELEWLEALVDWAYGRGLADGTNATTPDERAAMTSKRELREQLMDAKRRHVTEWDNGFATAARIYTAGSADQWAEHLARVADAAKAEGYREGYGQACEDNAARVGIWNMDGDGRVWITYKSAEHPQPEPEATPEPAEPAGGELNPFSADCGFFCHCAGPRPDVWQPGSVTR